MVLAWDQDRVIGFAATRRVDDNTWDLAGIIVLPSATGRGVGTRVIDVARSAARNHGYHAMTVQTETSNERALGFNEAHGFEIQNATIEEVESAPIEVWSSAADL